MKVSIYICIDHLIVVSIAKNVRNAVSFLVIDINSSLNIKRLITSGLFSNEVIIRLIKKSRLEKK